MKYESLPMQSLVIWEFLALLFSSLLVGLTLFILRPYTLVWYTILWIIGMLTVVLCFLYLPLMYISVRFIITEKQFILRRGVIFNTVHYLQRDTINFISVYRNPLTSWLNISSLMLTAPGAQVFILCMGHNRAVDIAKELSYEHKFEEI